MVKILLTMIIALQFFDLGEGAAAYKQVGSKLVGYEYDHEYLGNNNQGIEAKVSRDCMGAFSA